MGKNGGHLLKTFMREAQQHFLFKNSKFTKVCQQILDTLMELLNKREACIFLWQPLGQILVRGTFRGNMLQNYTFIIGRLEFT